MNTYLSKLFYLLGRLIPVKDGTFTYPIYRRLMLTSIGLDKKNIVWKDPITKEHRRKELLAKVKVIYE